MKKTLLAVSVTLAVALGVGVTALVLRKTETAQSVTEVSLNEVGLEVQQPTQLKRAELSDKDKQGNVLLRLQESEANKVPVLITVRYEDGLKAIFAVTKQEPLEMLLTNLDKSYPDRFPGFTKISDRELTVGDKEAAEIVFDYQQPGQEKVRQRLLIVIKDSDTAVYVAGQLPADQYDQYNSTLLEPVFTSLKFE